MSTEEGSVSSPPTAPPWKTYTVGSEDSKGRKIDLIFSHYATYVIYETGGSLQLEGTTDPVDKSSAVNRLLVEVLSVTPRVAQTKRAIYCQLAFALDTCMNGDEAGAVAILEKVLTRATRLKVMKGQLCYFWGCIGMALLISLVGGTLYISALEALAGLKLIGLVAALGSLGGILSVAINLKKIEVDSDSGPVFNVSSGAARSVIAVIGAIFIYFAIKGNLLLGLIDDPSGREALFVFAMLAGFSETLVPNSLKNIEGRSGAT